MKRVPAFRHAGKPTFIFYLGNGFCDSGVPGPLKEPFFAFVTDLLLG